MEFKRLKIPDVILIEPPSFEDDRGFFYESYNKKEFDKIVGEEINFVQEQVKKEQLGSYCLNVICLVLKMACVQILL